jgi:hypothetical protein
MGLALSSFGLAGCSAETSDGEETLGTSSQALAPTWSATELANGQVKYRVTLPSGQRYVEVFARKNGVQNLAQNITASGQSNGDGTTTYSYTKSGYGNGDQVEYRFYSYIGPGVFTPGATASTWVSFTYGASTFQTSAGNYYLGAQQDANGRTFSYQIEVTTGQTFVTPYQTGWVMTKASPQDASIPVTATEAELVATFVKKAGSSVYDPVTAYDTYAITPSSSAAWLDVSVVPDTSLYPGQPVDPAYAEGGHSVTINTIIGPRTLQTDATVTFAYLVKQRTWSGQ